MKKTAIILFAALVFFALPAAGQTQTISGSAQIPTEKGFYTFVYSSERVLKGAPYSAEATTESLRILGDGNKIIRSTKTLLYRDGEGRTRREEISKSNGSTEIITIFDPVAGYKYFLNPTAKTVRRIASPAQKTGANGQFYSTAAPSSGLAALPSIGVFNVQVPFGSGVYLPEGYLTKSEDFRPRTIEGVEATGKSSTTTILAGTIGNERDIVSTSEVWYSKDLQMTVLNKRSDPQTGDYTYELKNIKRIEPDKSLFTVPSDYKLVDVKSPVETFFGNPRIQP